MTSPETRRVVPIPMPQAGNSMEEGTLLSWKVTPGDRIAAGDVIAEIETDKSTMELEAPEGGRIALLVAKVGDIVAVREPLAYLAESDEDVEAVLAQGASCPAVEEPDAAPAPTPQAPVAPSSNETVRASPVARKIAEERGLDLAAFMPGSGPGGRIVSEDLERGTPAPAAGGRRRISPAARRLAGAKKLDPALLPEGRGPGGRILTADVEEALRRGPVSETGPTRRRMSNMRRAIARNLQASKQTVPHFYVKLTIDAEPLFRFYKAEKTKYPVSVNDVIVAALGLALMEFPAFRTRLEGEELVTYPSANIGIAVGVEDGLLVPVLVGAERLGLEQLAAEGRRLAERARSGKIDGAGQGVFTVSNLGMYGVEEFSAIINPPESGILAVSAIREAVVVKDGMMRPGRVMTMTLSCDHRVVDGMLAAQFLGRLRELLEAPEQPAGV